MRIPHALSIRDERGAVAVFVSILLIVLLAIGAVVADIGAVYAERRELQNGADAAALAVAGNCAKRVITKDPSPCPTTGGVTTPAAFTTMAQTYANLNAKDAISALNGLNGTPGVVFGKKADGSACKNCVTVRVTTQTTDSGEGQFRLLPWFAQVLDKDGTEVFAVATATWGSLKRGAAIPLAFSACEYNRLKDEPGVQLIIFHGSPDCDPPIVEPSPTPTPTESESSSEDPGDGSVPSESPVDGPGASGQDIPGDFGWLQPTSAGGEPCSVLPTANDWVPGETGANANKNSISTLCPPSEFKKWVDTARPLLVPIYTEVKGPPEQSNVEYKVEYFAAFVMTGFHLGGGEYTYWPSPPPGCTGNERCVQGYFTGFVSASQANLGDIDPKTKLIGYQLSG